jgi:cyclopropane fatty-acyl-phospholipid synthase-like methyltransferase
MNFNELTALRADLAFIAHWIAPGSQVLDLGCGDGVMLDYLQSAKQCAGYGVEIDDSKMPALPSSPTMPSTPCCACRRCR